MSLFHRRIAPFISVVALAATAAVVGSPVLGAADETASYLVVVTGDDAVAPVAEAIKGRGIEVEKESTGIVDYVLANVAPRQVGEVEGLPGVRWVEPNRRIKPAVAQTISSNQFLDNWGLDRIDQEAMPLSGNYLYADTSDGTGVDIYIVDTGIRRTHEEFTGRVATGYYDASFASSTEDDCGHGTHVSGIAAGTRYGVAKKATIVPVKIFPGGSKATCDLGTTTQAFIDGLNWVKGDHAPGKAAVANLSLGTDAYSNSLDLAVKGLVDDGIVVIVAAGNDGNEPADKGYVSTASDATSISPACSAKRLSLNGSLTVAATGGISGSTFTGEDIEASYSNYGPCVDIFAPGTNIRSAWPVTGLARPSDANNPDLFPGRYADTGVNNKSGTSMAAPFVSGAAALLLQETPTATPAQITARIIANATSNVVSIISRGAVASPNLLLYTCASVCPPGAPREVAIARAARTEISVTWVAPESDGGAAVTGYTATATATGESTVTCTSTGLSCTLTGLKAGTSYAISVAGANSAGTGALSAAQSLTPGEKPSAPGVPSAVAGNGEATVTWAAPTDTGGPAISKYTVTSNPGSKTCTPTAGALSCKFTGLTNGTSYTFAVTATNEIGESPASTSAAIVPAYPWEFVPGFAAVTAGSARVSLTWTQAKVRGSAPDGYFTGYVVKDGTGKVVCTTTLLKCTVKNLKNGSTMKFTVAATSIADTSQAATSTSVVVGGVRQKANGIRKGSRALLSGFATTNSKGKITWRALSGGCRVSGAVLTAPTSGKTCKLRISVAKSGIYPAQTVTLTIQIV